MSSGFGETVPRRVLVIEDDQESRVALAALIAAEGATVVVAESGREALNACATAVFDVVVSDLGLPDIPGDAVIRQLLATAVVRPWVIAMTGFGEPHLTRAKASGADVVLLKPVDWTRLRSYLAPRQHAAA